MAFDIAFPVSSFGLWQQIGAVMGMHIDDAGRDPAARSVDPANLAGVGHRADRADVWQPASSSPTASRKNAAMRQ